MSPAAKSATSMTRPLVGALAFVGLKWSLSRQTHQDLAAYQGVVKVVPQAAHVTITLP